MIIEPILKGLRVMVVEDELLIAMMIEDLLIEQQCELVGPYSTVDDALKAARTSVMDLAILDVNVRGEKIYPVAETLSARRIPFVLLSGYGDEAVPGNHPDWRAFAKPFQSADLTRILVHAMAD